MFVLLCFGIVVWDNQRTIQRKLDDIGKTNGKQQNTFSDLRKGLKDLESFLEDLEKQNNNK